MYSQLYLDSLKKNKKTVVTIYIPSSSECESLSLRLFQYLSLRKYLLIWQRGMLLYHCFYFYFLDYEGIFLIMRGFTFLIILWIFCSHLLSTILWSFSYWLPISQNFLYILDINLLSIKILSIFSSSLSLVF